MHTATRIPISFFIMLCIHASASEVPNFIVLVADDLGYGDLACYGHPTIRTPNLDEMAQEGIRLTSFYVTASVCSPSRASLLTGKYPSGTGITHVLNNKSTNGLPQSELTIAEGLKEAGYATAIIGKWHLGHLPGYLPANQGFDYWFGVPYSNDNDSVSAPGNDYLHGPPLPLYENTEVIERGISMETITRRYTEKAIEFIKQERDDPFFLYLPYTMPHVPVDASALFKGKSLAGLYGDVIEELDWSVGQILDLLEELQIEEKTIVVFTSDNGPMIHMDVPAYNKEIIKDWHHGSAGPLRGGKFDVYEGGFRVPAIIRWKGKIRPGRVSSDIIKSIDLLPTFFSLAGVSLAETGSIDGKNIVDFLLKSKESPHVDMVYERHGKIYAYRKGEWKIVRVDARGATASYELYHLKNDISEQYDVAAGNPDIAKELIKTITK